MKPKELNKTLKRLPIGESILIHDEEITRIDKDTYIKFITNNQIAEYTRTELIQEYVKH